MIDQLEIGKSSHIKYTHFTPFLAGKVKKAFALPFSWPHQTMQ
jgi:hypothetical protein